MRRKRGRDNGRQRRNREGNCRGISSQVPIKSLLIIACSTNLTSFRGAKVYIACRSVARGEEARKEIIDRSGNSNVFVRQLDLASFASIREFCKKCDDCVESFKVGSCLKSF